MSEFKPACDLIMTHECIAYGTARMVFWCDRYDDLGGETAWGHSMLGLLRLSLPPSALGLALPDDQWAPGMTCPQLLKSVLDGWTQKPRVMTQTTLHSLQGSRSGCLKQLTEDKARELYRTHYWDPLPYRDINCQEIASKLVDFAVNTTPSTSTMRAQLALERLGTAIDVDGALGPHTIDAINGSDSQEFLAAMCAEMEAHYRKRVAANPSDAGFLNGWLARAAWTHP